MSPRTVDLERPMSLLCENRPYTLSADGEERTFFFRPTEIVSVISFNPATHAIENRLGTFAEVASSEPSIARLPGTVDGRLNAWHLDWVSSDAALQAGSLLCQKRSTISTEEPRPSSIAAWLDQLQVPVLNADYVRRRLCEEHAHNLKAQQVPLLPSIGMLANPSRTAYLRLQTQLKRFVDIDLSETQILFLLGLVPSVGPSNAVSLWLKRYLPQILMPEILNLGRFKGNKFEMRLKNTIMQVDNYILQNNCLPEDHQSGSSLSIAVYMPDARLVIALALGDAVVLLFNAAGALIRSTYSLSPGDAPERLRLQQNGYLVEGECIAGSEISVSRAIGLYSYKSTTNKKYSRAFGGISSMPEVSLQRLSGGESVWLCNGKASQLKRGSLQRLGELIAANHSLSSQKLCTLLSEQLGLSDFMISKLAVGETFQM